MSPGPRARRACPLCGNWGPTTDGPCAYCPPDQQTTTMTDDERAAHQQAIVARIRAVPDFMLQEAASVIDGRPSLVSEPGAWAVLRLVTERPDLWDACAQLVQVNMLTRATEASEREWISVDVTLGPEAQAAADQPYTPSPDLVREIESAMDFASAADNDPDVGKAEERRADAGRIADMIHATASMPWTVERRGALVDVIALALANTETRATEP